MTVQSWLVDAFADGQCLGNPAGVVIRTGRFPQVHRMQALPGELGLPTVAFVVPQADGRFRIRWFTPLAELNICGHATIAAATVLFDVLRPGGGGPATFVSPAGELRAWRDGRRIAVDLPLMPTTPVAVPPGLADALGAPVVRCERAVDDLLIELPSRQAVAQAAPDFAALARIECRGHVITAAGEEDGVDFVSRAFFPALGVDEDQVCVSAHCKLAPFWSLRSGRLQLSARQLSPRGGRLAVEVAGDRVHVAGASVVRRRLTEVA